MSAAAHSSTYSLVLVDARQVPQEVADVSADAEVVQFAGIDRDAHLTGII